MREVESSGSTAGKIAQRGDVARQHGGGVQMRERGGGRRVGQIVGRHVNRLHRGDRALVGGGDAFLQIAHLGRQGRLITHRAGNTAQQRRHFRTGLGEAEDVVDEQQHVLAFDDRGNIPPPKGRSAPRGRGRPAARSSGHRPGRIWSPRPNRSSWDRHSRWIRSSRDRGRCLRGCARPRRPAPNSRHRPWRCC